MNIKALSTITLEEINYFGGKAANLGHLISKGFNVPFGIALSMSHAKDYDLEHIEGLLKANKLYSVRSSATAEDGGTFSFAGQFETVLDVKVSELASAIAKVYDSQYNARVSGYQAASRSDYFGIVIQEMVDSDISGVLFTANPIDSNRKALVIESTYGLGEAIVSGQVNTDKYLVEKETLEILEVSGSLKEKGIRIKEDQLIEAFFKDDEPSLKYEQVLKVAELGLKIEAAYSSPQDIEFALKGNQLYVLQSRPITTLWPDIPSLPEDHVLMSFNAVQMMMDPFTPLGSDVMKDMATISGARFLYDINGYLYSHVDPLFNNRFLRKFVLKALTFVDEEAKSIVEKRPIIKYPLKDDLTLLFTFSRIVLPKAIKARRLQHSKNHSESIKSVTRFAQDFDQSLRAELEYFDDELSSLPMMHEHLRHSIEQLFTDIMPYVMAGMMARAEVQKKYGAEYLAKAEKGLTHNLSSKMGIALEGLSDHLILNHEGIKSPEEIVGILEKDLDFKSLYETFLREYGFRGAGEIDIANERYLDNPETLNHLIYHQYTTGQVGRIRALSNKQALEAEALDEPLVRTFRAYFGLREHPKYAMMRLFYAVKEVYLKLGDTWVRENRLEASSDIFMLHLEEILEMRTDYKALAEERKKAYVRNKKLSPPKVMEASGRCLRARRKAAEGTLVGTAASAGTIRAQVRIVKDISEATDMSGKILVTQFTDPGWTPVFNQIAGLITEVGGMMTHGSVVAREYGIPAVVGVSEAMDILEDGQWVILDGSSGIIILESETR